MAGCESLEVVGILGAGPASIGVESFGELILYMSKLVLAGDGQSRWHTERVTDRAHCDVGIAVNYPFNCWESVSETEQSFSGDEWN